MVKKVRKGKTIKVDFTGVETGSSCADGQYKATVEEVTQETSENSGEDYLLFILKTESGAKLRHMCSLQPQALWKLRRTIEALGFEVPDGAMDVDPADFIGETLGVVVENEMYQGRRSPKVTDTMPADEVDESGNEEEAEEEEEEERPKKKSGKPAKKSKARDEEEEEEEQEEEEEEAPPARRSRASKGGKRRQEPEEEEEEEEEEEPEAPKTRRKTKGGGGASFSEGQRVTFEDDGETHKGKIVSIEGKSATVAVGKEEWEIPLAELAAA